MLPGHEHDPISNVLFRLFGTSYYIFHPIHCVAHGQCSSAVPVVLPGYQESLLSEACLDHTT